MILVLGLGNPVRGDDAVGLRVAEAVERLLQGAPIPGVSVATSTRAGLDLIPLLEHADAAIIVDAFESPDAVPGRVRRLGVDDVSGVQRLVGVHDVTIGAALALGRESGLQMPGAVEIYAVEAGEVGFIHEHLTDAVAAAVEPLAREIYERCRW
jgi:hydrogenase maturation protease